MSTYNGVTYGDISPRVGIFAVANFLAHAVHKLELEKYAQVVAVPKNVGNIIKFRRSVPFDAAMEALTEGVTPSPMGMSYEDVTTNLQQYGSWIPFTDVIADTHEDDNLKQMTILAGEQAALTKEKIVWNVLIGGTSVIYSGTATSRNTVVAPVDLGDFRLAQRTLKVALARPLTKMVDASEKIATQPIAPAYVAFGHTNLEQDLRNITGFIPREQYSNTTKILSEQEIGKIEDIRFILAPQFTYFPSAGGTPATGVLSTNGVNADVYPLVIIGADAFGVTPLKGMDSARVAVKNPKLGESETDPLGQRGFVAWKMWYSAVRLNETWMVRIESAVSAL